MGVFHEGGRAGAIPPGAEPFLEARRIAVLAAERRCFVMQALLNPVPIESRALLNGEPLAKR